MKFRKATQQQTKEHNRNLVLKTIFEQDSTSRAEIARLTGLTRTTVSDIVAELLDEYLVSEIGFGSSLGGKSPILLSVVEDSRYLIGLDLAQSKFRGGVVNLRGKLRQEVAMPVNDRNGDEALALVYEIVDQLIEAAYQPLVGIGVGTPGLVNTSQGVVVNAVNLDWKDLPLSRLLQDRYQLPVYILNDSQAAAMGEYAHGNDHPSGSSVVVINVRHGIGAGIIINGQLFQGDSGGAGEIGHTVVAPESGVLCRCGNYGCLETVASAQALVRQVQLLVRDSTIPSMSYGPHEIDLDLIARAFFAGEPQVQHFVLETGRYLGLAISSLIGTLNIHKIVLVGDMTRFGESWLDVIRRTISSNTLSRLATDTRVEIGQLGDEGVIQGASALLANNYSLLFRRQFTRA